MAIKNWIVYLTSDDKVRAVEMGASDLYCNEQVISLYSENNIVLGFPVALRKADAIAYIEQIMEPVESYHRE